MMDPGKAARCLDTAAERLRERYGIDLTARQWLRWHEDIAAGREAFRIEGPDEAGREVWIVWYGRSRIYLGVREGLIRTAMPPLRAFHQLTREIARGTARRIERRGLHESHGARDYALSRWADDGGAQPQTKRTR